MLMWLSFGSLGVEVVTCQHCQCYSCYHLLHQIIVDLPVTFSVRPFQTYIGRVTSHIRQCNHRFFHLFCLCEKVCLMSWDLCTFCTLSIYLCSVGFPMITERPHCASLHNMNCLPSDEFKMAEAANDRYSNLHSKWQECLWRCQ